MILLFLAGLSQFCSTLFIAKYFDYIQLPYFTLFIVSLVQVLNLAANRVFARYENAARALPWLGAAALVLLSRSRLGDPVVLSILEAAVFLTGLQYQIFALFKKNRETLARALAAEMTGAAAGALVWCAFSAPLGFFGFAVLIFILQLALAKEKKFIFGVFLAAALFLISEPQPVFSKRDYAGLLKSGEITNPAWDPDAHTEVYTPRENPAAKILLFDGGILQSTVFKFDGDYAKLRASYLNSDSTKAWGLDVILPHYVLRDQAPRCLLISAVGGQEILAARAFNAGEIWAVEINRAAQKTVAENLAGFGGNIYDGVHRINQDGRFFAERAGQNFDLIQIYSAYNASFTGSFGAYFLPSSLVTREALQSYEARLSEKGILDISQPAFYKIASIFDAAFGKDFFLESPRLLVIRKASERDTEVGGALYSFYLRKQPWSKAETDDVLGWLSRDPRNHWDIVINPLDSAAARKEKLPLLLKNSPPEVRPATDDWPFAKLLGRPIDGEPFQFIACAFLAVLGLGASSLFVKNPLRKPVSILAFLMGAGYSVAQSLLIISVQKNLGHPARGLALGLALCLISGALAALLSGIRLKGPTKATLWVLAAAGITFILSFSTASWLFILGLLPPLLLQSYYFSRLCLNEKERIVTLYFFNGLGLLAGFLLFNILFVLSGLTLSAWALALIYAAVALGTYAVTFPEI